MANQQADAKVTVLNGKAYAERNGTRITLTEGADIYASDTIITDSTSGVEVVFRDNAVIKLGPGSQVAVQDFVYDGESNPSFAVQLVTGVMTSLSGEVVKQNPAAFKISTPRATIGIRGTETYHSVQGDMETHAVVHISQGHIVMLNSSDGQAITLGSAMQAVTLSESGSPLTIRTFQPNEMDKLQNALSGMGKKAPVQDGQPEQDGPQTPNTGDEGGQESAAPQPVATSTVVQDEIRILVVAEAGTEAVVAVVQDAMQTVQDTTGIIIESPVISPIGTDVAALTPPTTLTETLVADNPATPPTDFVPPPAGGAPVIPDPIEPPVTPDPIPPVETWENINVPTLMNDSLTANDGNDSITVEAMTTAIINAGAGNDIITIGTAGGLNTINGGAGSDTLNLDTGESGTRSTVTITGVEHVYGNNSKVKLGDSSENVTLHGMNTVTGGSGNDTITVMDTDYATSIKGGAGDDLITVQYTGSIGNDSVAIEGDTGNDTINIHVADSNDGNNITVSGGAGDDVISITGALFSGKVYGDAGNDTITIDILQAKTGTVVNADVGAGNDHIIIKHIAASTPGEVSTLNGGLGQDTFTLGTWDDNTSVKVDVAHTNSNLDTLEFSSGAREVAGSGYTSGSDYAVEYMQDGKTLTVIFADMNAEGYEALKSNGQITFAGLS